MEAAAELAAPEVNLGLEAAVAGGAASGVPVVACGAKRKHFCEYASASNSMMQSLVLVMAHIGDGGGRIVIFGTSRKNAFPSNVRPTAEPEATSAVKMAPRRPKRMGGAAPPLTSPTTAPVEKRDMLRDAIEILIGSLASSGWKVGLLSRLEYIYCAGGRFAF